MNTVKKRKRISAFDVVNYTLLTILSLTFVYPIIMTFSLSISNSTELVGQSVFLLPKGFSLDAYKMLLSDSRIIQYYINTIVYAGLGTLIMLICTTLMAYPLSFKDFRGKGFVTVLLLITMFFGGGLVPTYLTLKNYGMLNTVWVMVIPGAISAWNVIIFKTFFVNIPDALKESAYIDGAGHFRVLWSIVVPLSKPLLATMILFSVVGYWNDYFSALMYLSSDDKMPIQMLLRRMLVLLDFRDAENAKVLQELSTLNSRTVKSAATIITIVPILCVYPYLQKYFAKGIMVGSVKA